MKHPSHNHLRRAMRDPMPTPQAARPNTIATALHRIANALEELVRMAKEAAK